ncbi:MAG: hypothetical protein ACRD1S_07405 [Vicinamibacterales bacterium]
MRMIKRLINLAIVLAIAHAGYNAVPVYWRYVQFRDEVTEVARFSGGRSEKEIRDRVAAMIIRYEVPLDPSEVPIVQSRNSTAIDASYEHPVELLPKYFYKWKFDVNLDVVHVRPTSVDQIR